MYADFVLPNRAVHGIRLGGGYVDPADQEQAGGRPHDGAEILRQVCLLVRDNVQAESRRHRFCAEQFAGTWSTHPEAQG